MKYLGFLLLFIFSQTINTQNALNFKSGDYLQVNNPQDFDVGSTTDFTIEAFIQTPVNDANYSACLFSKMQPNTVSGFKGYQFWIDNGIIALEWANGLGNFFYRGSTIISDGMCHHVAAVVDRSANNIKLYVDGVAELDLTQSRLADDIGSDAVVYIGREREDLPQFYYDGILDNVIFSQKAKSQEQIDSSAARIIVDSDPDIVGLWKLDEGTASGNNPSDTTAVDASGGNNAALNNFSLTGTSSNWIAEPCGAVSGGNTQEVYDILLTCSGSATNARVAFISKVDSVITLRVYWDEGSTFVGGNLTFTNATCVDCRALGGIGRPNPIIADYIIHQTDPNQAVTVAWAEPNTSAFCGGSTPVVVPGTEVQTPEVNNALSFLQGDYVLVSNPDDFNVGAADNFTIEAIVKSTYNAPQSRCIFSKMVENFNPNQPITGYQLWAYNGRLTLEWANNNIAAQNISGTTIITDGACHHVAVVVDRVSQNAKLYVDGVLEADVTHSRYGIDIDNIAPVYIGRERQAIAGHFWVGDLDEVAFFKTARTVAEIEQSATSALAGSESGLTGYWKFNSGLDGEDNTAVTTAIDASGGNNGTLIDFDLTGTQVVTNAPDGTLGSTPIVTGTWVSARCGFIEVVEQPVASCTIGDVTPTTTVDYRPNHRIGQTFTACETGQVTSITIQMDTDGVNGGNRNAGTHNVVMGPAAQPMTKALSDALTTVVGTITTTGTGGPVTVTLSTPFDVTKDQVYAFAVDFVGTDLISIDRGENDIPDGDYFDVDGESGAFFTFQADLDFTLNIGDGDGNAGGGGNTGEGGDTGGGASDDCVSNIIIEKAPITSATLQANPIFRSSGQSFRAPSTPSTIDGFVIDVLRINPNTFTLTLYQGEVPDSVSQGQVVAMTDPITYSEPISDFNNGLEMPFVFNNSVTLSPDSSYYFIIDPTFDSIGLIQFRTNTNNAITTGALISGLADGRLGLDTRGRDLIFTAFSGSVPGQDDADDDGEPDSCDTDDDNDGQSDADEIACGSDPMSAASVSPDEDNDGVPDCVDFSTNPCLSIPLIQKVEANSAILQANPTFATMGQSFVAPSGASSVDGITVDAYRLLAGEYTLSIFEGSVPSTLGTPDYTSETLVVEEDIFDFENGLSIGFQFGSAVPLTPGTEYYFIVDPTYSGQGLIQFQMNTDDAYNEGQLIQGGANGSLGVGGPWETYDLIFELYQGGIPGQDDLDNDGMADFCDDDNDNDGQTDEHEIACGSDPNLASSMSPDADNDSIPDCIDMDVTPCVPTPIFESGTPSSALLQANPVWATMGQSFLPLETNELNFITLDVLRILPRTYTLTIYEGPVPANIAGATPYATAVQQTYDEPISDFNDGLEMIFEFTTPVVLNAGTEYYFIVDPTYDTEGLIQFRTNTENDFIAGKMIQGGADGSLTIGGFWDDYDLIFSIVSGSLPSAPDMDGDGESDTCDIDDDGDGQTDEDEIACGSDPLSAASLSPDSDGDGIPDCLDDSCDCNPDISPLIPNAEGGEHVAAQKCTHDGFTHFCDGQGRLLLSLDSTTAVNIAPTDVRISIVSGTIFLNSLCEGSGGVQDGNCFISNDDGALILCRTWDVNSDATNASVRYYFDDSDIELINSGIFERGLNPLVDLEQLWFYKVKEGSGFGKPQDLAREDVIIIDNDGSGVPSETSWVLGEVSPTSYYAEYQVSSFSGGGGGGAEKGSSPICPAIEVSLSQEFFLEQAGNITLTDIQITGGTGPYNLTLDDGTNEPEFSNGASVTTAVSETKTLNVLSVIDANDCPHSNIEGAAQIFVQGADNEAPTALCVTDTAFLALDNFGMATLTTPRIDNGSLDNEGVVNRVLSQEVFTCFSPKVSDVTLTVFDASGNQNTCTSVVSVTDPNSICCPDERALFNIPTGSTTYKADIEISTEAAIRASDNTTLIKFEAGNRIEFITPFSIDVGAILEAIIKNCDD